MPEGFSLDFLDPAPEGGAMLTDEVGPVAYTDSVEEDSRRERTAIQAGFAARAEAETARRDWAEDGAYYTTLVFQSHDQMKAFREALGIPFDRQEFMDGREIAARLGIELPPSTYAPSRALATESQNDWLEFVPEP